MTQRTALVIAAAVTAFMLVLVGGVAANVASKSLIPAQAHAASATVPSSNVAAPAAKLTTDQAAQISKRVAPAAKLTRTPELVNFQGAVSYEIVTDQGVLYLDANNGQVLFNGTAPVTSRTSKPKHEDEHHNETEHDDD